MEQAYIYDDMGERKLVSLQAFSYMIDQHHNLWYNHDGFGYISFHQKNIDYITNTPKGMARALTEDHQKRLWIGWKRNHKRQPGNLCLYDSLGQWIGNISRDGKLLADHSAAFNVDVYCIYEDREQNIWLGTKEDGLFCLLRK